MKTRFILLLSSLAGCVTSSTFSSSSPRASGADTSEQVTIPNVFKMREGEAIAALRRAGVQGNIARDSSLCGSLVEGQIVERDEVCYQHPAPDRVQGARLPVTIRVQSEDPRRGNIGKVNEWRLMPKLVGMTYEQALAEMKRAGFMRDDRLKHVWADETSCKPNVVCRQYPEPLDRIGINDGKVVYVGQDPSAKHARTNADSSTTATTSTTTATTGTTPTTATTTTPTSRTTADPASSAARPLPEKPEAPPEPFFGAPTAATTPASPAKPAETKHWGGDGTPAHRDSANVPQGPGGPLFMGKGAPCSNKIDHCMRPGTWFAADNVVAGKLYRGTPVFEFEGTWWTWRGVAANQPYLFRTKVVDDVAELEVGKPVVIFFVDNPKRRWLENEYDTLTSSRWSVGVIESVSPDSLRVRGWSAAIAIDTVRVIIEEKRQPK